jgi:thiol-disulfide isomerase/thioredoxin
MARLKLVFAALALLILCAPAHADPKADRLLKQTEARIASLPALTVNISATVRDQRPNRNPLTFYEATVRLARPNLARIDYGYFAYYRAQQSNGAALEKHNGVIAADGKSLWAYDLQKNQCRKDDLSPDGQEISINEAFPLNSPIYSFFHGHIPHAETSPAYVGEEVWKGKTYRVIEFRQGADSPNSSPILQRLYVGADNLVHRFVNVQMGGQYVEDCAMTYFPAATPSSRQSFAYAPPADARIYTLPPPPTLAPGRVAPQLAFEDRSGQPVQLSALRGKVVVLEFWAIGCGHCLESQAHLNDIAKKFAGDAVVVALDVQDTKNAFSAWLAKHPQYPALLFALAPTPKDQEMAMMAYDVPGFPEAYVIDRDGKVVKALFGYDGPTPDLANAVRDALKAS